MQHGGVLDAPSAYVEIHARTLGCEIQQYSLKEAHQLCERLMQVNEQRDRSFVLMAERLMVSHVQLQQGAVQLLEFTDTTIQVAHRLKAERQPVSIDVDHLARTLAERLQERAHARPPSWIEQLIRGPLATALTQLAERFVHQGQGQDQDQDHAADRAETHEESPDRTHIETEDRRKDST